MKKMTVYLIAALVGYFSVLLFMGNEGPQLLDSAHSKDILLRRNFLIRTLVGNNSPADFLQEGDAQYAGEWTLGTYGMATYALTNIAMSHPQTAAESSKIISKWIDVAINQEMTSFDEVAWFGDKPLDEKTLQGDEGHIGFYGHVNLMLGCYALLNNDGKYEKLHRKISEAIARRMRKYPHRQIETYPGEAYPPDNTVAAASLRVADMTLNTNYKQLIDEWVKATKKLEDSNGGLVVFQIDIETGKPLQTFRGSNIGWNSFFMPLVDEEYAKVEYDRFKELMLRRFGGFAAFKEYPKGGWFKMDRDTGPVVFGLGGSATGFGVAGAKREGDPKLLSELLRSLELIAVSVQKGDEKRYLASPVVGDAIMLAMKTACSWKPVWRK